MKRKWVILALVTVIPIACLASYFMDGWQYYLMGALVTTYGIFCRLAGGKD